jgi:hypothetical protein
LLLYGKYSYGYNLSPISSTNDRLTIIDLDSALANTLNITAGIALLTVLTVIGVFLYEAIQFKTATHADKEIVEMEQASTAQMTSARIDEVSEPVQFRVKRRIVNLCL